MKIDSTARDHLQKLQTTSMERRDDSITKPLEHLISSIKRVSELSNATKEPRSRENIRGIVEMQMQELQLVETFLTDLTSALQQAQEKSTTDLAVLEWDLGQLSNAIRQMHPNPQGRIPSGRASER